MSAPSNSYPFDMPLAQAMTSQRSIRKITQEPVPDELLIKIVELGCFAPNARNAQDWEFILVKDAAVKKQLAQQNRALWKFAKINEQRKAKHQPKLAKVNQAVQWAVDNFESYPAMLVACYKGPRFLFPQIMGASTYGSLFPAVQNMMLAARAEGLGVNLATMPLWHNRKARKILNLPRQYTPTVMLTFGWPKGKYGPTTRKPVGDVLSLDQYGNKPWTGKTSQML